MSRCHVSWCEQPVKAASLCSRHYERQRTGKELEGKQFRRPQGMGTDSHLYSVWTNMKTRCNNPNATRFENYGGRGVTYCPAWEHFVNFEADMLSAYKPGLTLERRKNEEGYSKDNCYWATVTEQNRNSRNCKLTMEKAVEIRRLHEAEGVSLARLGILYGVSRKMIEHIIKRKNWV